MRGTANDARAGVRPAALAALGVAASLLVVGVLRHRNFWSEYDLAIFDQGTWQLSRGSAHVSLIDRNIFADHFSPVMVLFAPLYRIVATPVWLIGAQAIAIAATVAPMRRLGEEVGSPRWLPLLLTAGSGPLLAAGVFDFHAGTLAVPFIAVAVLAAVRDRPMHALLASLAVVVCRADLAWALFGVAVIAGRRTRLVLVGIGVAGVAAGTIVPALLGGGGSFETHYGHLGSGPGDALLHPWRVVPAMLDAATLRQLATWLLGVAFLPLVRPRWTLALVVASLPVLLSQWPGTTLPWHHYGAPYVPIAVGGALVAYASLRDQPEPILAPSRLPLVALVGVVACLLVASPLSPRAPRPQQVWWTLSTAAGDAAELVDLVRSDEGVSASYHLVSHLSHRDDVYLHPLPFDPLGGTLPQGLAPEPDAAAVERTDVVIVERRRRWEPPDDFRLEASTSRYDLWRRDGSGG